MKDVWMAQWYGDTHPQFIAETLEKLYDKIDEWHNYKVDRSLLKRNTAEFEEDNFGTIAVENEIIYILNYYF
jgi:hypothetical protein